MNFMKQRSNKSISLNSPAVEFPNETACIKNEDIKSPHNFLLRSKLCTLLEIACFARIVLETSWLLFGQ
jgi:hypothetical protein